MTDDFKSIGVRMHGWAAELWPLCRSITGPGIRETIDWLEAHNPELVRHPFSTGTAVFDWTIPKEWTIRDAWIEHESGSRFAQFKENNLHVLGYSAPLDCELDREDLLELIYTQEDQPERIPYVTSYYEERSGFCMSAREKAALPPGRYRARIDSDLQDGELIVADVVIPGETRDEVLFSTYICHPSMANNELSGPVLANGLAAYVRNLPVRRMTYRFLFLAETIGAVAYLSKFIESLRKCVAAGFVLSCVGDERAWSHVQSRGGDTVADAALSAALVGRSPVVTYSFLHRGSDERQFCAPGVDLPVCGFSRTKHGEYPEYHTDADDLNVVTPYGLQGAFDVMKSIIDSFEVGLLPRTTVIGEPQLGKRGLYSMLSQKGSALPAKLRTDILAYADGKTSLFDMASLFENQLSEIVSEVRLLKSHKLIK